MLALTMRIAALSAMLTSVVARGGRGPPITPGQGCYDMSGGISGSSHVCLYTPEHCCQAGCEANGGYWIDGTGAQTCSSDPDCDDDDDRTPCGCDALTQCGDGTGATDVNGDGSIDLDCSDGNCDKLCVLGNCPEEEGGPICGPLGPRFGGGHGPCVSNPECQWCETMGGDVCAPQGSPMCPARGGGGGRNGGGGGGGGGGRDNTPDPSAERGPNCSDGIDNDDDGDVDCADDECCVGRGTGGCRAVCAARTLSAIAVFHTDDGLSGTVSFSQLGSADSPTSVRVSLTGLQDGPNPWHVHESAVMTGGDCSDASVGGHFDPTGYGDGTVQGVWDLSGAGGDIDGGWQGSATMRFDDPSLPLFGDDSIMGRSVVIHRADGSRWACATIVDAASPATAQVQFQGQLQGSVSLTQYAALSPTIIEVDFNQVIYGGSSWEVHTGADMDHSQDCGDEVIGGHYLSQEVWDLTASLGNLGGTMHWTKTSTSMPLFGGQSVGGHSVVVRNPEGQAWACAPIEQLASPPDEGAAMAHFGVPEGAPATDVAMCSSPDIVSHVNSACCSAGVDCSGGVPSTCTMNCAPVFLNFWDSCRRLFKADRDAARSMRQLATQCEDAMSTAPTPASSLDNLGTGCSWVAGDGVGGGERNVGTASTPEACVALVQRTRPDANGATYQIGGFDCYAEMDMSAKNSDGRMGTSWQTCYVDGSPSPEEESEDASRCEASAATIMQELQQACGFSGFALPRECSVGCASVFTPLYRDCQAELQMDLPGVTMTAVQAFVTLCSTGGGAGGGH